MDQPGKVANPARGQLNRENEYSPVPRACLRIWSRETSSAVPSRISLLISILTLNLVLTYGIPTDFRGGVHLFIYIAKEGTRSRFERDTVPSQYVALTSVFVSKINWRLDCMCVCFLPIHSGHQVRWTYQPGSHRRKVTQDF